MDALLAIVQKINFYLSDYVLIFLLIGTGLYFTIKTNFVQVRCLGEGFKAVFGKFSLNGGKQEGGMSSFQALATAIAAQVGTGNMVGASGAILVGGPGAIFWMWIIAFFGMATIYAEAVLAQETRIKEKDGTIYGGPVFYKQKRYTKDSQIFEILKFRSMIVDAEKDGRSIPATGKDPRITKVPLLSNAHFALVPQVPRLVVLLQVSEPP